MMGLQSWGHDDTVMCLTMVCHYGHMDGGLSCFNSDLVFHDPTRMYIIPK